MPTWRLRWLPKSLFNSSLSLSTWKDGWHPAWLTYRHLFKPSKSKVGLLELGFWLGFWSPGTLISFRSCFHFDLYLNSGQSIYICLEKNTGVDQYGAQRAAVVVGRPTGPAHAGRLEKSGSDDHERVHILGVWMVRWISKIMLVFCINRPLSGKETGSSCVSCLVRFSLVFIFCTGNHSWRSNGFVTTKEIEYREMGWMVGGLQLQDYRDDFGTLASDAAY
jgi:hypothetical protein